MRKCAGASPLRPNAQSGLGDTARTNAARAHTHALPGFTNNNVNVLQVRIPAPFCQIVGMTYPVPINRAFIANFTTSHEGKLLREMNRKYNTCYNPPTLLITRSFL